MRVAAVRVRHLRGQMSPPTGALQRPPDRRRQNHGQPVCVVMARLLPHVTPREEVPTEVRIMPAGQGPLVPTGARQRFVCQDCIRVQPEGQKKMPDPRPPLGGMSVAPDGLRERRGHLPRDGRDGRRPPRVAEQGTDMRTRAPLLPRMSAGHMRAGLDCGMRVKWQGTLSGTPCTTAVHMLVGRVGVDGGLGGHFTSVQTPLTVRKQRLLPFC